MVDITNDLPSVIHQDHPANYSHQNESHRLNYAHLPPDNI
jgi:hypothetical protein